MQNNIKRTQWQQSLITPITMTCDIEFNSSKHLTSNNIHCMCMYIYMIYSTCSYTHMYNHTCVYKSNSIKQNMSRKSIQKYLSFKVKKVSTILHMFINQKALQVIAFVINTIYGTSFTNNSTEMTIYINCLETL